ncbi:MAG: RagB/SusD family nutrient uptake outer membrane protein [Tannerella sp.]|jgi:hypothetical protein|nr:RagB/SusD family nutrient uptake outer membrane protein [Tannerella sp.]
MKSIIKIFGALSISLMALMVASCDYLDVVPDNIRTVDDIFADRYTTEAMLATCYWGFPKSAGWNENPAFFGSMETCFNTYQQTSNGMQWGLGLISATNVRIDYWGNNSDYIRSLYAGIRDCNTFMDNVMGVPDLRTYEKNRMFNEAKLIKAFMHFYLLKYYGPICPLRESPPVSESTRGVRVYREKVDDCFNYVLQLINEVIESNALPLQIVNTNQELGRFTNAFAYTFKAFVLTYWASPLFNGNTDYNSFLDHNGEPFFNQTYDPKRWDDAAAACIKAVEICTEAGHRLYQTTDYSGKSPSDNILLVQTLRNAVTERWNPEIIWGNSSYMATYGRIQQCALPRLEQASSQTTNGNFSVPLHIVDLFYTKNGLPIENDPEYDMKNHYATRVGDDAHAEYIAKGETTAAMNFDREPRFYSTLGFDRGIWWGNHANNYPDNATESKYPKGRLNEYSSVFNYDSYNTTGYWPKKLVHLLTAYRNANDIFTESYPWPDFRFADLLLITAEAINESKGPVSEVFDYIDLVRQRAGLNGVVESWKKSDQPDYPTASKDNLRNIIRRERQVEFACEGINYWDSHRWKTAMREQGNLIVQGWNIRGENATDYYVPTTYYTKRFTFREYLAPIPEYEIINNPNLIQNPGW